MFLHLVATQWLTIYVTYIKKDLWRVSPECLEALAKYSVYKNTQEMNTAFLDIKLHPKIE